MLMILVFVTPTTDEAEATLKYAVIVGHQTLKEKKIINNNKIRYIIICSSHPTRDKISKIKIVTKY